MMSTAQHVVAAATSSVAKVDASDHFTRNASVLRENTRYLVIGIALLVLEPVTLPCSTVPPVPSEDYSIIWRC